MFLTTRLKVSTLLILATTVVPSSTHAQSSKPEPIFHKNTAPASAKTDPNPRWAPGFYTRGLNAKVRASAIFDDGTGPALYVGGDFVTADDRQVSHLAKWDGQAWHSVGKGTNASVSTMTVFDDGTGPALFIGGAFSRVGDDISALRIAKWDGSSWSALGAGIDGIVYCSTVFDDGTGPALYVGGYFPVAGTGGSRIHGILKWSGSSWQPMIPPGETQFPWVFSLTVFDDGNGPALFAGGNFSISTTLAGDFAENVVRWDGSLWSPLGSGLSSTVNALAAYDDGAGPALYAGGFFRSSGVTTVDRIAKWSGSEWLPLGDGLDGRASSLEVFDDGSGEQLYVGGDFSRAGGLDAGGVARWNGTDWSTPEADFDGGVEMLISWQQEDQPALFAGGTFSSTGTLSTHHIAYWRTDAWKALTVLDRAGNGVEGRVLELTVFDDGQGPELYAAGQLKSAGEMRSQGLAKWDGSRWTPLAGGATIAALARFDDGDGPKLYAAGSFSTIGGVDAARIASWDGAKWSALEPAPLITGEIQALQVFDDGNGPALYVAGRFTDIAGSGASWIAKWDGTTWSALGAGLDNTVEALEVFDDGNGPALYAGGNFTLAGGLDAQRIAKWDGATWSALGTGLSSYAFALTVFDDGTGPALYAGGSFSTADGIDARSVAKWDGTEWSALGSGVSSTVFALEVFDDGRGPALYAGGSISRAGEVDTGGIAKWDGSSWHAVDGGVDDRVYALAAFDDGSGPALYAGGGHSIAGGLASSFIAKYSNPTAPKLSLPPMIHIPVANSFDVTVDLVTGGHALSSTELSLDYDASCLDADADDDGLLDQIQFHSAPDFDATALLDSSDTDGEIDISIADAGDPPALLYVGRLMTLTLKASCSPPLGSFHDAAVVFSTDPPVAFGDRFGQSVAGSAEGGVVRIWSGQRGDCNASGHVDTADLVAIASEIFDDDDDPWFEAPGSSHEGNPVGCDANGSKFIRAADVACTQNLISQSSCTRAIASGSSELVISPRFEGGMAWIRVQLLQDPDEPQPLTGLALSLDLNQDRFDFAAVDENGDGTPDHLRFPQGTPKFAFITWDADDVDGELDLLLSDSSSFAQGRLVEIGIPSVQLFEDGIEISSNPPPSFATVDGDELTTTIGISDLIFADGFESGDTSHWILDSP